MDPLDNNMDELFRKAGDLYPLKTSEPDWDQVLGKLREENSVNRQSYAGLNTGKKSSRRRWLLLMILVPVALGSMVYFSSSLVKLKPGISPVTVNSHPATKTSEVKNKNAAGTTSRVQKLHTEKNTSGSFSQDVRNALSNRKTREQSVSAANRSGLRKKGIGPADRDLHLPPVTETRDSQLKSGSPSQKANTRSTANDIANAKNPVNDRQIFNPAPFVEPALKTTSLSANPAEQTKPEVHGIPLSMDPAKNVSLKDQTSGSGSKSKRVTIQSHKGLYIGFLAGPDLSSVNFQSVKQPGYSLGVLAGYRFNQRLSIETGLFWDKKYYYSNGNYFNKSRTSIPAGVTILNVNGNCNMFEIPINLRYDFSTGYKHGFFAKAGLSSYLMKKENYSYLADYSGTQYTNNSTYNNSTNNIFSILQLSGGYDFAIGSNTKIQIEPYLKIPVQGIGIGSMPISSAGIYFGITHSFR